MYRRNMFLCWILSVVLVLLASNAFMGCSSKSVAEDDEVTESTTLTINASPATISVGATSIVEATLLTNDAPMTGQEITFTVEPGNIGYFSPVDTLTDDEGVAASVFTGTAAGTAVVTAQLSTSALERSANITVTEVAEEVGGNVGLSISPASLLANGEDTARVTVTVRDANGSAAPESTIVKIAAGEKFDDVDGNGYWSPGLDQLEYDANNNGLWDGIGLIPSMAFTGTNGAVTVDYVSGSEAQTSYIKVTVDEPGFTGVAQTSIQLTPDADIHAIYLSSDSINLVVRQTGGIEIAPLRAVCYDLNGNRVPEGLEVSFVILDGPGGPDPEHLGEDGYGPCVATTNGQGIATAMLHSGTGAGTVRIRAMADTILSNATQVMVSAGPPAYIVVGSEYCNVDFWDNVALLHGITAVVSDIYLNPVNDSTVVYFSTDEGTMKSHEERTRDLEGIARTKWFAGNNVDTADGIVYIIAETAGNTVADTSYFFNTHLLDSIIVTGLPASMLADGMDEALVQIDGIDLNGNPVISGTKFQGDANYLTIPGGILENGCGIARDYVTVSSSTLDMDASTPGGNDDAIGAIDYVRFWAEDGRAFTIIPVILATGYAYRPNCKLEVEDLTADYDREVFFMVTVKDRWSNPLGDHTIGTSASNGAVITPIGTGETDAYGSATFSVTMPPANSGVEEVLVQIQDTDPRGVGISFSETIEIPTDPLLNVAPPAINFGAAIDDSIIVFTNAGTGQFTWAAVPDSAWVTLGQTNGSTTLGPDTVAVSVDRTGLPSATYTSRIDIQSDAGNATVTIYMTVP